MSETAQRIEQVDPKSILRPKQARTVFEPSALRDLVQSIQSVGILHPLLVRREEKALVVLDGERRLRAAIELALPSVPVVVVAEPLDTAGIVQRQLVSNCIRENLSPIEQASAIRELMNLAQCSAADAAKMIGKSAGHVSKLLSLLSLSAPLQEKITSGELSLSAGHQLSRIADSGAQERASTKPASTTTRWIAVLDKARTITVGGIVDASLDAFAAALEEMILRVKAARKQGIELATFLSMLRDQAKA